MQDVHSKSSPHQLCIHPSKADARSKSMVPAGRLDFLQHKQREEQQDDSYLCTLCQRSRGPASAQAQGRRCWRAAGRAPSLRCAPLRNCFGSGVSRLQSQLPLSHGYPTRNLLMHHPMTLYPRPKRRADAASHATSSHMKLCIW